MLWCTKTRIPALFFSAALAAPGLALHALSPYVTGRRTATASTS